MKLTRILLLLLPLLGACDQLKERAGLLDPVKQEAEGKAIGGACRHAGRGLEDCYRENPDALKAAVFAGWKEMNEYMLKNSMSEMPPAEPEPKADKKAGKKKTKEEGSEGGEGEAGEAAAKAPAKAKEH